MKSFMWFLLVVTSVLAALGVARADIRKTGDREIYPKCEAACMNQLDYVCEPAYEAQARGEVTQEQADAMCKCGLQICVNTCVGESGAPGLVRPLAQICYDLNVY